jgi:hypothetical protein
MIRQQQLRTSPEAARMMNVETLFLEFHNAEMCFSIPTGSVGRGFWFEFIFYLILTNIWDNGDGTGEMPY